MNSLCIVEIHIMLHAEAQLVQTDVFLDFDVLIFESPLESFLALSRQHPRLFMLMEMTLSCNAETNSVLVNWQPCSRLKISGFPERSIPSLVSLRINNNIHRVDNVVRQQFSAEPVYDSYHEGSVTIL